MIKSQKSKVQKSKKAQKCLSGFRFRPVSGFRFPVSGLFSVSGVRCPMFGLWSLAFGVSGFDPTPAADVYGFVVN
eukprot:scaffold7092_cov262-Pinguiococcus_pyrenoidosus.AAC.49